MKREISYPGRINIIPEQECGLFDMKCLTVINTVYDSCYTHTVVGENEALDTFLQLHCLCNVSTQLASRADVFIPVSLHRAPFATVGGIRARYMLQ